MAFFKVFYVMHFKYHIGCFIYSRSQFTKTLLLDYAVNCFDCLTENWPLVSGSLTFSPNIFNRPGVAGAVL